MRSDCNYNYKVIGENYVLFSSGIDGKSNTADDFYPQFAGFDSTRIGWIKE
jgi:hypothetical protein